MSEQKYYVSYETVHKLVKGLAERVEKSGYDPDVIVAIGSGGFIPARILKTFIHRPIPMPTTRTRSSGSTRSSPS